MRILKYIFLLILLALVGTTVYVATQKGDFNVTKSYVIKTPRSTVFDYVNDFKNWESFGSWMDNNKDIKFNYAAKTLGAGAKFSWENGSDEGNVRTFFVKENDSLSQTINFNSTSAIVSWKFNDAVGGTRITLNTKGKLDIFTKISIFFKGGINAILSDVFEKSLRNLDQTLAYEMKTYSIKIDGIVQRKSGYCLKQTVSCPIKSVAKNIKIMMPRMIHFFKKNKIKSSGKPFVMYERYDVAQNFAKISICMPVETQIFTSPESDITSEAIIPFTCLKTTLTGDYSHNKEAWKKAEKYIVDNGYKHNYAGNYSEVYLKTIDDIKQPSKWVTEILIPIFPKESVVTPVNPLPSNSAVENQTTIPTTTETP